MGNIFVEINGKDKEVLSLLQQAIDALKNGDIAVSKTMLDTAPSAFQNGYTDDKEASFFGFSFKKVMGKPKVIEQPKLEQRETCIDKDGYTVPVITKKLSDREAQQYRIGTDFICRQDHKSTNEPFDCGYTTDTIRGFKVHFNRCEKRNVNK